MFRKKAYLDDQEDEDPEMTGEEMKKEVGARHPYRTSA